MSYPARSIERSRGKQAAHEDGARMMIGLGSVGNVSRRGSRAAALQLAAATSPPAGGLARQLLRSRQ